MPGEKIFLALAASRRASQLPGKDAVGGVAMWTDDVKWIIHPDYFGMRDGISSVDGPGPSIDEAACFGL